MSTIADRLKELGIVLPAAPRAVAAYAPYVITGQLVYVSGQLPMVNGSLGFVGKVGNDLDVEKAQQAARLCALNILSHLEIACDGNLDRVDRCVKIGGFVASAPEFYEQPKVINGASEFFEQVFGAQGKHARFAVGVLALPRNAAVEIDAIFSLKNPQ